MTNIKTDLQSVIEEIQFLINDMNNEKYLSSFSEGVIQGLEITKVLLKSKLSQEKDSIIKF